jgi:hypothetical protein
MSQINHLVDTLAVDCAVVSVRPALGHLEFGIIY